jgi:hypothetical protein
MATTAPLPKKKLVELLVTLLQKKGQPMVQDFEKRVKAGQGLQARGVTADSETLQEALDEYDARQVVVVGKGATEMNSPQRNTSSPASSSHPPKLSIAESKVAPSGGGARWCPAAPSATLLASKAQMECENAEQYVRTVQVVSSFKVAVLTKPDMLADMTGTILNEGQKIEVVARFLSHKDGRVYLRLKNDSSAWVSTRSRKEFSKVVIGALPGESPLEPPKFSQPIVSTALRFLPELDSEAASEVTNIGAGEDLDADVDDDLHAVDENAADAPAEDEAEADDENAGMEEVEDEADEEGEEEEEEEGEEDPIVEEGEEDAGANGKAANDKQVSPSKVRRYYHKFKVVISRCSILESPNAQELMSIGKNKVLLQKQEFISDGVFVSVPEQRFYLRLTRGRGWVCEQSSKDLRRWAVAPLSRRRQPLSRKMARAVAFRGGDTEGMTRLGKDDLIRNKYGKIVSKRASEAAAKRVKDGVGIGKWTQAVKRARDELGLTGFVPVKKGSEVYERAQKYYKAEKAK